MKFLLSHAILKDIQDPRIGLVTVLDVKPTEDLKEAKVYVSVFGTPGERSAAEQALQGAVKYLQTEVGRNLETRFTPKLRLVFVDPGDDRASSLEARILKSGYENQEVTMARKPAKKPSKPGAEDESPASKPSRRGRSIEEDEEDAPGEEEDQDDEEEEGEEESDLDVDADFDSDDDSDFDSDDEAEEEEDEEDFDDEDLEEEEEEDFDLDDEEDEEDFDDEEEDEEDDEEDEEDDDDYGEDEDEDEVYDDDR